MAGGLYEHDVLAWSAQQADLIRRIERGERVNDVDWANIAEEIEAVGRSELHSVESFLIQILVHLLKLHAWPDSGACNHWREEIVGVQSGARRRFTPSMRQKINLEALHADALGRLRKGAPQTVFPADNPYALDELIGVDQDELLARLKTRQ